MTHKPWFAALCVYVLAFMNITPACTLAADDDIRPVWADREPDSSNGRLYFRGISGNMDVPDESLGIRNALADACEKMALKTGLEKDVAKSVPFKEDGKYHETGTIAGSGFLKSSLKHRYFVLIYVLESDIAPLQAQARLKQSNKLDVLLAASQKDMQDGRLDMAAKKLESATALYPGAIEAWTCLAGVREKQKDWDNACLCYETMLVRATNSATREQAGIEWSKANEQRVATRLEKASLSATNQQFQAALEQILDAATLKPSFSTLARLRIQYYETLAAWLTKAARLAATNSATPKISLGGVSGDNEADCAFLKERLVAGKLSSSVSLSEDGVKALMRGQTGGLRDADRKELEKAGDDYLLLGLFQESFSSCLFDLHSRQVLVLPVSVRSLNKTHPIPASINAWALLPNKLPGSPGIEIQIWPESKSFRLGDVFSMHVRARSACHVVIIDQQTSGDFGIWFANAKIQPGEVYAIPGKTPPFFVDGVITVEGRTGWEGLRVIATRKSLAINGLESGPYAPLRTETIQRDIFEQIRTQLLALPEADWGTSDSTFEITR